MKQLKSIMIAVFALFAFSSQAQKAIGLRFGGGSANGADISYQMSKGDVNRLQFDLGLDVNGDYTNMTFTGTYQWLFDLSDVTDGLQWYAGPGAQLGFWNLDSNVSNNDDNGSYLGIGGIVGIEYVFTEVPIQVSLDTRPMFQFIDGNSDAYWGIGLGVRYLF